MLLIDVFRHPRRATATNARRYDRLQLESPVIMSWEAEGVKRVETGVALDISEGGTRVKVNGFVPLSTQVHLRFPDLGTEAMGWVRHAEEEGIGVEFSDVFFYGPRKRAHHPKTPRDPDRYLLPILGAMLMLIAAYSIPGLLPEWMPFTKQQGHPSPQLPSFFTLGSTRRDVYSLQGAPTRMTDSSWYYGPSSVSFKGEFVSGWAVSPDRPLRTGTPTPKNAASKPKGFTVGSTASEVLEAQGPPLELTDNVWKYGKSEVYFKAGKVVAWRSAEEYPLNTTPKEASQEY